MAMYTYTQCAPFYPIISRPKQNSSTDGDSSRATAKGVGCQARYSSSGTAPPYTTNLLLDMSDIEPRVSSTGLPQCPCLNNLYIAIIHLLVSHYRISLKSAQSLPDNLEIRAGLVQVL